MTTALKLDNKGTLQLSEADVTRQVCDFMAAEGWRHVRHNVGGAYSSQAVTALLKLLEKFGRWTPLLAKAIHRVRYSFVEFGEPGMPDSQFIRYDDKSRRGPAEFRMGARDSDPKINTDFWRSRSCVMWCEMKAPGKKPAPHQLAWHEAERARGALVKVVDHFETYRDWYRETFS